MVQPAHPSERPTEPDGREELGDPLATAQGHAAGKPCAAEANAAKFLGAEACFRACESAMFTHGGMGYAKEFHVERFMREIMIARIAPVSRELALCHVAEKALGLPKSY